MFEQECAMLTDAWVIPEQLLELVADDSDLLTELIAAFQEDTKARLLRLQSAASSGDALRVRSEAHTIKGGSRQIGATPLADISHHLEMQAASMSPAAMMEAVSAIESRFTEACAAMSQYLQGR